MMLAACGNPDNTSGTSGPGKAPETHEQPEGDGGNAGDESMPNTMALAATQCTKSMYDGKIDGKIEASLSLYNRGGVVRGSITYKKGNKPIMVLGRMEGDGNFFLREYLTDGLITGVMSGKTTNKGLSGSWYGTSNHKDLKLEMSLISESDGEEWPFAATGSVAGEYAYHYPANEAGDPGAAGTLIVKQKGDKVTFSFDCVNGPPAYNMATIEDMEATLSDNFIQVDVPDFDCEIAIEFFKGFASVLHPGGHYDCGFGHGAGIEGQYVKVR